MEPLAIILSLLSAFFHAGWNLLARRQRSEVLFLRRMLMIIAVAGLAPMVVSEALTRSLSPTAWLCAIGSGCCFGVYFYALAHAYELSDFTIVYPVSRALPVLLVAGGEVVLGRPVTLLVWAGMGVAVAGCFLAPLTSFGEFAPQRYLNRAGIWTLVVAVATAGFTLIDKTSTGFLRTSGPATAARYECVLYLTACLAYLLLYHNFRGRREDLDSVGWRLPAIAAACTFVGYWLVLWALQHTTHAAYVVTFRQFSVVIGVVLAFVYYREKGLAPRLTATVLIMAGLLLIGLWGR